MLSLYISKMVACSRLGGRKQKSGEDAKARKVPEKGGGGGRGKEKKENPSFPQFPPAPRSESLKG